MRLLRVTATSVFFILGSFVALAQPGPPTSGPTCFPPPCVPIDGGIGFLIAAGVAFGAKKIYDSRKRSKSIS